MKAAVIYGTGPADVLKYAEAERPEIGAHDIRVKTAYAAVNPVDIWTRMGITGIELPFPCILGWDVAGTVEAIGPKVSRLQVGDPVMGMVTSRADSRSPVSQGQLTWTI